MKKHAKYMGSMLRVVSLIVIMSIVFISGCGIVQQNKPTPSQQNKQNENLQQDKQETGNNGEEQNDDNIKPGTYKVGTDLEAGEYVLYSDGSMAYFQVSKDSTGSAGSIITSDSFFGTRYITVSDGQYIQLKNAWMLPIEKAPVQKSEAGVYKEGMYKVGRDIKAGEYKIVSDDGTAYVEVSKDSLGKIESIITNDIFEGEKHVAVKSGQYLKLMGCHIEVK